VFILALLNTVMNKEVISILGCGWYGLALAKALLAAGYVVKGSTTSEHKIEQLRAQGVDPYLLNLGNPQAEVDLAFFDCAVLIICIPPRKNNSEAAIDFVSQLKNISIIAAKQAIANVIFISSTGVYQDGNFVVNETIPAAPTHDTGKSLLGAEALISEHSGFVSTIIRFGGLIGPDRNLAKHFAGKKAIANGRAPINLIHLEDCIGLMLNILATQKFGHLYHGVCPDHPTREDFYTQLCRETGLAKPEFINELVSWKQIDSVNVPGLLKYEWKIRFELNS
jgi:nucleoside-diphosphate-sugar epimerase